MNCDICGGKHGKMRKDRIIRCPSCYDSSKKQAPIVPLDECPRCGKELVIIWGSTDCPICGLHFECC